MNIVIRKTLSILLIFTILFMGLNSVYAEQSIDVSTNMDETAKKNLTFLIGEVGDDYLVYTYEEDGSTYKIIDEVSDNGDTVNSQIFIKDENGVFSKSREEKVEILPSGDIIHSVNSENANLVETIYDVSQDSITDETTGIAPLGYGEWTTLESNGSSSIRNLTISAIVTVLTAIATNGCSLIVSISASLITGTATNYFTNDASKAYYYKSYSWKTRTDNVFVISNEAVYVQYFYDAAHKNYTGYVYKEYNE